MAHRLISARGFRHTQATAFKKGTFKQDMARKPTEDGVKLIQARRAKYGFNGVHHFGFSSEAVRCVETIRGIDDRLGINLTILDTLGYGPRNPAAQLIMDAFDDLGYDPVITWVKRGYGAMLDWGRIAHREIIDTTLKLADGHEDIGPDDPINVIIGNHAPTIASVAMAFLREKKGSFPRQYREFSEWRCGEAEGFRIDVTVDDVTRETIAVNRVELYVG